MTFGIHVKGGTGAGRRIVKSSPPKHTWVHECDSLVAGAKVQASLVQSYRRCPHCGIGRPT